MKERILKVGKGVLVALALVVGFSSCEKKEDVTLAVQDSGINAELLAPQASLVSASARSVNILSEIPVGAYSIASRYKQSYYHINQYDNSATASYANGWPNGIDNPQNCSWTTYVIATGCVARATGKIAYSDYRLDKARRLKEFMKNSRGSYSKGSVMEYIYRDYGLVYDNNSRVGLSFRPTGKYNKTGITTELLTHLKDFQTPIMIIATSNRVGHYYTVVGMYWGGNIESSDIWVTDSTKGTTGDSFESSKQRYSLKEFLELIAKGKDKDYYRCNMLFTYALSN